MFSKKGVGWLVLSLIGLFLLGLIFIDMRINYLGQILTDYFAVGVSNMKLLLFLVYFSLSCFILFLNPQFKWKAVKKLFLIWLAFSFLLGLFSYVWFIESYGLSYSSRYELYDRGEMTSTKLSHIHNFKGALSFFVGFFSQEEYTNYDEGSFFYYHSPAFFWLAGIICLFGLLVLSLLTLVHLNREIKKEKLFFLFFYLLSSFSLIKNVFDGGLFSPEVVVWSGVFFGVLFFHQDQPTFLKGILKGWLIVVPLYMIFLFFFQSPYPSRESALLVQLLKDIIFVLLIYLLFFLFGKVYQSFNNQSSDKSRKIYFWLLGFALFVFLVSWLVVWAAESNHFGHNYIYLNYLDMVIPQESEVYLMVYDSPPVEGELLYQHKRVSLFKTKLASPSSILNLAKKYHLSSLNRYEIMVPGFYCRGQELRFSGKIKLLKDSEVPEEIKTKVLTIKLDPLGWGWYNYEIISNDCLPQTMAIALVLDKEGLTPAIMET